MSAAARRVSTGDPGYPQLAELRAELAAALLDLQDARERDHRHALEALRVAKEVRRLRRERNAWRSLVLLCLAEGG